MKIALTICSFISLASACVYAQAKVPTLENTKPTELLFSGKNEFLTICPAPLVGRTEIAALAGIFAWQMETGNLSARQFVGSTEGVNCAAFSPDGKILATGSGMMNITGHSDDPTIRLWDSASGKEIRKIETHRSPIIAVQFSPDGKKLLGVAYAGLNFVSDVATGEKSLDFKSDKASFSPDGSTILAWTNGKISVLDASTGKENCAINAPDTPQSIFRTAEFSPDGKSIVTSLSDKTARTWDAQTGKELMTFEGHTASVTQACFSKDGKSVFTASDDASIRVWDAPSGKEKQKLNMPGAVRTKIQISPDEKRLVAIWEPSRSGRAANDVEVYGVSLLDLATAKEMRRVTSGEMMYPTPCAFLPDGKLLAVRFGTVQLWDTETGTTVREYKNTP